MSKNVRNAQRLQNARRHSTALHNLSQLSQLRFKKLGQRKPNEYAMSQLSQVVPTVFNKGGVQKRRCGVCDGAGRELNSRRHFEQLGALEKCMGPSPKS